MPYTPIQSRRVYRRVRRTLSGIGESSDQAGRTPARRTRDAHPQSDLAPSSARLRHPAAYPADFQRAARNPARLLLHAIYRLEHRGWIEGEWGESENNRRARFYALTRAGTRQLKAETAKWTDMAAVVAGILDKKADEI
jgi:hypothetical protein